MNVNDGFSTWQPSETIVHVDSQCLRRLSHEWQLTVVYAWQQSYASFYKLPKNLEQIAHANNISFEMKKDTRTHSIKYYNL